MYKAIFSEFLKLRRSKILLLVLIAGILPSLIKLLQSLSAKDGGKYNWQTFISSDKEIMVLGTLITVILASGFIFNMEYQYKTISYILTWNISKIRIFFSKMVSIFFVIVILLFTSFISENLSGFIVFQTAIPADLLEMFLKVEAWYLTSYFLLSSIVAMISVLTRKYVITSVISLGFFMLTFPFHLKDSIFICPFMTPSAVAAKIYGFNNYIFNNAYRNMDVNTVSVLAFLIILAIISTIVGLVIYKKSDAPV